MIILPEKSLLPKGVKIPRKRKKWFKKNWGGVKVSLSLNPNTKSEQAKKIACIWILVLFHRKWLNRYNQINGFYMSEIKKDDPIWN